MVLCKALEPERGSLVFYTHRPSPKGRALAAHGRAAAVFYFGPDDRQVRMSGPVTETSDAESDAYFATRPPDAQVGAWASRQSEPVGSRAALEDELARRAREFGVSLADERPSTRVPRPPHWGGYRLVADSVELWHGRPGRLHDRALWTRDLSGGPWRVQRLQP